MIRQLECGRCRAPYQVLDDSFVAICEHCGAIVTIIKGGVRRAERSSEVLRTYLAPSVVEARRFQTHLEMQTAQAAGDLATWRLWARELYTLSALHNPEQITNVDQVDLHRWVADAVMVAELMTVDAKFIALRAPMNEWITKIYSAPDPLAVAHKILEAANTYFRALLDDKRYPPKERAAASSERRAAEHLRVVLEAAAPILKPGMIETIRAQVLGDKPQTDSATCQVCGADQPGDEKGQLQCSFCGAVIDASGGDAWVDSNRELWMAGQASRRSSREDAEAVIALALSGFFGRRELPDEQDALRLLSTGPTWVSRATWSAAIANLRAGMGRLDSGLDRFLLSLDIALQKIAPETEGPRPAPKAPLPRSGEDDGWVLQTLAHWRYLCANNHPQSDRLAESLLGLIEGQFQLGGSVSLDQALEFLNAATPCPPLAELATLARWRAQHLPGVRSFLRQLADALEARSAPLS